MSTRQWLLGWGEVAEVEFLARLEADCLAGGDGDLGAGPGIAADSGLAGANGEGRQNRGVQCGRPRRGPSFRLPKTVSTAASARARGRPVRSITWCTISCLITLASVQRQLALDVNALAKA